jgi:hypothetical protein
MTSISDFLGLATTLVVLGVIVAGVMKVFQIASDMQEIKEALKDLRRSTQGIPQLPLLGTSPGLPPLGQPAAGLASLAGALPGGNPAGTFANPPTAEELVRAIHAQDFRGENFPL